MESCDRRRNCVYSAASIPCDSFAVQLGFLGIRTIAMKFGMHLVFFIKLWARRGCSRSVISI